MSMNAFMHPRNLYKTKPDFFKLGESSADFRTFLMPGQSGRATIDFSNKDAVRALTKALLAKDFNLCVEIPENKLIPTLPLRLNYLLWIEDLLKWKRDEPSTQSIHGIDIGTGASCIYPLLASKTNSWRMTATETDQDSTKCAEENVEKNGFSHLIQIVKVDANQILDGVLPENECYDFCMCNPPFFGSESETDSMSKARSPHREPPKNASSGSGTELVVQGGELEFVKRIIADSKKLHTRIRIFTTMVGHKKNAYSVMQELESSGAINISKTEFCQGNTTRWGIAWTFSPEINWPSTKLQVVHNKKLQQPMEMVIPEDLNWTEYTVYHVTVKLLEIFSKLQLSVKATCKPLNLKSKKTTYEVIAKENTWSNQRRKRREQKLSANLDAEPEAKRQKLSSDDKLTADSSSSNDAVLFFKMHVGITDSKIVVKLTWNGGSLGRDSLHQILQCVKNSLAKNDKK